MKHFLLFFLLTLCPSFLKAQPRPFEIDESFSPALSFMQKSWSGTYDGMEPNSRMYLTISRHLILSPDMTYLNEVKCFFKDQQQELVLKYEKGTYQYSAETKMLKYIIDMDSTLDINIYLKGEALSYQVNHYTEEKTSTEQVQFTPAADDAARLWVLFDPQLMSPVDPRQKAVYTMTGESIDNTVRPIRVTKDNNIFYDLNGRKTDKPFKGVYIYNHKKRIAN